MSLRASLGFLAALVLFTCFLDKSKRRKVTCRARYVMAPFLVVGAAGTAAFKSARTSSIFATFLLVYSLMRVGGMKLTALVVLFMAF